MEVTQSFPMLDVTDRSLLTRIVNGKGDVSADDVRSIARLLLALDRHVNGLTEFLKRLGEAGQIHMTRR